MALMMEGVSSPGGTRKQPLYLNFFIRRRVDEEEEEDDDDDEEVEVEEEEEDEDDEGDRADDVEEGAVLVRDEDVFVLESSSRDSASVSALLLGSHAQSLSPLLL